MVIVGAPHPNLVTDVYVMMVRSHADQREDVIRYVVMVL